MHGDAQKIQVNPIKFSECQWSLVLNLCVAFYNEDEDQNNPDSRNSGTLTKRHVDSWYVLSQISTGPPADPFNIPFNTFKTIRGKIPTVLPSLQLRTPTGYPSTSPLRHERLGQKQRYNKSKCFFLDVAEKVKVNKHM